MHTIKKIAVVAVLALFAIAGVLNISKAEEAFIIFDVQSLEEHDWSTSPPTILGEYKFTNLNIKEEYTDPETGLQDEKSMEWSSVVDNLRKINRLEVYTAIFENKESFYPKYFASVLIMSQEDMEPMIGCEDITQSINKSLGEPDVKNKTISKLYSEDWFEFNLQWSLKNTTVNGECQGQSESILLYDLKFASSDTVSKITPISYLNCNYGPGTAIVKRGGRKITVDPIKFSFGFNFNNGKILSPDGYKQTTEFVVKDKIVYFQRGRFDVEISRIDGSSTIIGNMDTGEAKWIGSCEKIDPDKLLF